MWVIYCFLLRSGEFIGINFLYGIVYVGNLEVLFLLYWNVWMGDNEFFEYEKK